MPAAVKRPRPASDSEGSGHEQRLAPPISLKPSLRASLRDYRDHVSETDMTETETEDADAELGGMLTSMEQLSDDADVDACLTSMPQSPLKGYGKGKGVDLSERYPLRSTEQRRLYAVKRTPVRKRVSPGCNLPVPRATRRIVSPTESIYTITKCIDGLATSPSSMEDEKRVSSSLIISPATSSTEPLSPVPRSPSPAPDSEPSEDEAERDWLLSPLAYKLRESVRRRRVKVAKRRAAAALVDDRIAKKGKKWHESPDKESLSIESLDQLARQMGYKVVPASPKGASDATEETEYVFQIPGPVKEVDIGTLHAKEPLSSPKQIDALLTSSAGPSKIQTPGRKRGRPSRSSESSDVSEDEKQPAPKQPKTVESPPRRRDAPVESKRTSVRVIRERHAGAIPKSKHVTKRPTHQARATQAQSTTSPAAAPPATTSATRPRFLRRKIRRSLRPVALYRPSERKTLSGFHTADTTPNAKVMPGHEFIHVRRAAVIHRRVRNNMLHRHRLRTDQAKTTPYTPIRERSSSLSNEDEEVDMLLESDVEMIDNEEIETALASGSASTSSTPKLNAPRKRPTVGTSEAAERRGRRATLRADEVVDQAERLKEFFAQCASERREAKQRKEATKRAAIEWLIAERQREAERAEAAEVARIEAETAAAEAEAKRERQRVAREAAAAAAYAEERAQLAARVRMRNARLNLALHRERIPSATGFVAPGQRMRAATTPIRTFAEDEAERAERCQSIDVDRLTERSESESSDSEDEAMETDSTERTPPTPRTPSPRPQALPLDSPPTYEYPFYPIIRAAPAPEQPSTPHRPRRRRASDPPVYVQLRERTDRSPSPPPPYNAETDAQTVIPPVFHPDRERVEADLVPSTERRAGLRAATPTPESPIPAPRPSRRMLSRTLPGYLSVGESSAGGASEYADAPSSSDEDASEEESAPLVRTIRRWLGW